MVGCRLCECGLKDWLPGPPGLPRAADWDLRIRRCFKEMLARSSVGIVLADKW